MAATASVTSPADPALNAVVGDVRWVGPLTFSFPNSFSDYESPYSAANEPSTFEALNGTQQTAARLIFGQFAAVANLSFTERTHPNDGSADIRIAESNAPGTAWAYDPSTAPVGGDVWFNKADYNNPVIGNYAWMTFIHELGHSVGLDHPHTNGMPGDRDSVEFTVMTYRSFIGDNVAGYNNGPIDYPHTLMMWHPGRGVLEPLGEIVGLDDRDVGQRLVVGVDHDVIDHLEGREVRCPQFLRDVRAVGALGDVLVGGQRADEDVRLALGVEQVADVARMDHVEDAVAHDDLVLARRRPEERGEFVGGLDLVAITLGEGDRHYGP